MKNFTLLSCMVPVMAFLSNGIEEASVVQRATKAVKAPESIILKDYTNITKADKDQRMKWWRDAKFGIFIHFGPYAVMGGEYKGKVPHACAEWIKNFGNVPNDEYRENAKHLTLEKFDANAWVKAIKDAGAKYIVITTKHHDGFCMFDSALTKYDIKDATPYGKDFMKELSGACKKQGIKFCTYYSVLEWDNPELESTPNENKAKYLPYMKGQLAELIGKYGTELLWFDGEWDAWWKEEDGREIYNYLRTLKPNLVVNNRITKARQGMGGMNAEGRFGADFGTPEQEVPDSGISGVDWESCITMNHSWGFAKHDNDWKTTKDLLHQLIDTNSKGGNYLLNLGPRPDGTIPETSLKRLKEMGKWMKVNGKSIYGTTHSPFDKMPWGRATQKGDLTYLFIYEWPENGQLKVPFKSKGKSVVSALSTPNKPLAWKQTPQGMVVDLKGVVKDSLATVLVLKGTGKVISGVMPEKDGTLLLSPDQAKLSGGLKVEESGNAGTLVGAAEKRIKNIGWWTSEKGQAQWQVNVPKNGTYKVTIDFACDNGTGGTPVKIETGGSTLDWKVAETGSWNTYQTKELGTIQLKEGKQTIKVVSMAKSKEGVVNIRSIILTPIKK
ncbi:MAG: alpha-L-fucosidase [Akkermansia sp.]